MRTSRHLWQSASRLGWVCRDCQSRLASQRFHTQGRRWITQNHIRKILTAQEEWNGWKQDVQDGHRQGMLDILEERGYINQIVGTRDDLNTLLTEKRVGVYVGVDPTAPSLHVGHMVPFMAMGWMFIHGYSMTMLLGGFTSGIGDPIGRLTGREAQSNATRTANSTAMHQQLKRLGASMERYAESRGYLKEWAWRRAMLNNYSWWQKVTLKDFLRVMGAGTRIGPMLGRDTVKTRLDSGDGMSFAEFTYPLVQAWDWWELFQRGCQIQIGGADQFGNLLAGAEAVKHLMKHDPEYQMKYGASRTTATPETLQSSTTNATSEPMGFTVPLLTTSSGEKFGKSAGNAVWLDPGLTSSFDLYQFFLRSADADVEKYLKLLTFLPMSEIRAVMAEQEQDQSQRAAQHRLAYEFVSLAHGEQSAKEAAKQHRGLFQKQLTVEDIKTQLESSRLSTRSTTEDGRPADLHPSLNKFAKPQDMHTSGDVSVKLPRSLVVQQPLSRILWSAGLVASRSEGQRLINNKGVYLGGRGGKGGKEPMGDALNYVQIEDPQWSIVSQFLIDENLLILRTGKWRVKAVTIVPDEQFEAEGLTCPGWNVGVEDATSSDPWKEVDLQGEEMHRRASHIKATDKATRQSKTAARRNRARVFQHSTSQP